MKELSSLQRLALTAHAVEQYASRVLADVQAGKKNPAAIFTPKVGSILGADGKQQMELAGIAMPLPLLRDLALASQAVARSPFGQSLGATLRKLAKQVAAEQGGGEGDDDG